jgi:prevent-host-death family protein
MYTEDVSERTQEPTSIEVGVRDLRADLRRWLAVAQEREVVITERGRPVARLVPIGRRPGIERLAAEGRVTPPSERARLLDRSGLVKARGSVSGFVAEQRR